MEYDEADMFLRARVTCYLFTDRELYQADRLCKWREVAVGSCVLGPRV